MDQPPKEPDREGWKWAVKPETGNDKKALSSTSAEQTTIKTSEAADHDACPVAEKLIGSALVCFISIPCCFKYFI